MHRRKFLCTIPLLLLTLFYGCGSVKDNISTKINGVNLVMPAYPQYATDYQSLDSVGANYAAIVPFGFIREGKSRVFFDLEHQWWGEGVAGVRSTKASLDSLNLKVMLKPHLWVQGSGWPGELNFVNETKWLIWEESYTDYVLTYAKIAQQEGIELFCIGNELSPAALERADYWNKLIEKVRELYDGEIIYAANWDNFEQVTFWSRLDYIGINAYFPLQVEKGNIDWDDLWEKNTENLHNLSSKHDRSIIFTEYGYLPYSLSARGHWLINFKEAEYNESHQAMALRALYRNFWPKKWFKGGFLWKWYPSGFMSDSTKMAKSFSPQRKKGFQVVQEYYKKNKK